MNYIYAVVWFLVGLLLVARMGRENKIFYILGGYFFYLSVWWTIWAATGTNMFVGVPGVVLRIVTGAALVATCVVFFRQLTSDRKKYSGKNGGK